MADAPAFDHVCEELERTTILDRLAARGTIRLALKAAGFETRSVTPAQMATVVLRVLPKELGTRGVEEADAICERIRTTLSALSTVPGSDSPEEVFRRLVG